METLTPASVLTSLKSSGHRITRARAAIVDAVLSAGMPVSAHDVHASIAKVGTRANVTTVYRELEFLRDKGFVTPLTLADGVQRFEPADLGHHHHLVCLTCRGIQDVHVPHEQVHAAEQVIARTHGFTVVQHTLEFYGYCAACR